MTSTKTEATVFLNRKWCKIELSTLMHYKSQKGTHYYLGESGVIPFVLIQSKTSPQFKCKEQLGKTLKETQTILTEELSCTLISTL